jgi:hypothetical protein
MTQEKPNGITLPQALKRNTEKFRRWLIRAVANENAILRIVLIGNNTFMRRPKLLHSITDDMRRIIDIRSLARHGAFKGPGLRFPFQHLESAPDHIRVFRVGDKTRQTPQIVRVQWRPMTFGLKPFFVCPRCNARRVFLYHDSLFCYCRTCADLWYLCQRKRRRTRLLSRSHKLRLSLGDQDGKPGNPFPARPYLQTRQRYNRTIAKLRDIERAYLHIVATDGRYVGRERDEQGRFMPREPSEQLASDDSAADDLGR